MDVGAAWHPWQGVRHPQREWLFRSAEGDDGADGRRRFSAEDLCGHSGFHRRPGCAAETFPQLRSPESEMAVGKRQGSTMTLSSAAGVRVVRIAAALIVDQAGKMLLVRKRGTIAFMQAGGKIERLETPHDALSRELAEELRIDLGSVPHEFIGHFAAQAAHEEDCVVAADIFYVRIPGAVAPSAEIEEIAWIDPF